MPFSADITLPREVEPRFPSRCVRCLGDVDRTMEYRGSRFSWSEVLFVWVWVFRDRVVCEVPVCDACRPALRGRKRLELAVLVGVAAPVAGLLYPWLRQYELGRQWDKLITVAVGCAAVSPYFVWSVLRPPAFDMSVRRDVVQYEFASEGYATLFVADNAAHVVEVDGEFDSSADSVQEESR